MALLTPIESANFISAIPNPRSRITFMLHYGTALLCHLIARLDARSAELNFENLLEDSGVITTATAVGITEPTSSPATATAAGTQKTPTANNNTATAYLTFNETCARDLRAAHDVMRQALWTLEELEAPDATATATATAAGLDATAIDEAKAGVEEMAKLLFWAEEMVGVIEVQCQGLREQVFNAVEG